MILEAGRFMKGLRIILIAALFWILSSAAALADGCVGDYHVGNIIRTTIVAPSCVAKGVDQYQCSECGYIWIQEVPITDHTWKMETPAQTATCTNEGTEPILKCAVRGETTGGAAPAGQEVNAGSAAAEPSANVLADGVYVVDVDTGSNMFHINEAKEGKGELTVKNGEMTLHITLASKKIVNLYIGTAEEAEVASEDELLAPTTDEVTYSDGITEEAYGFDIPCPAIDEPFDVSIIGTHGNWYTHPVTVTTPVPVEN